MKQKIFCVKTYYWPKYSKIVQARYRKKFSFNIFLNRSQIYKLVKNFEAHGTDKGHRAMGSLPPRPLITIQTPKKVTKVQELVGHSPSRS